MILIDVNILLYAYDESSPAHAAARRWVQTTMEGPELVRLAWITLLAFLRISTNHRAFRVPLAIEDAADVISSWLSRQRVGILDPGERHWEILSRLLISGQARGPLTTDAHLAALAIEHGALLCSTDRDFDRFPGLRLTNPLQAG